MAVSLKKQSHFEGIKIASLNPFFNESDDGQNRFTSKDSRNMGIFKGTGSRELGWVLINRKLLILKEH